MARMIKVLAVCGFGVGTSLMLKMNIEDVLRKNEIDAEVMNADVTTAASVPADIIFTSEELYSQLQNKVKAPMVIIKNFINKAEIEEKGIPVIKSLFEE